MLNQEQSRIRDHCKNDGQPYLHELTALVIEGLAHEPEDRQCRSAWPNSLSSGRSLQQKKVLKLLATGETAASTIPAHGTILPVGDGESSDLETDRDDKLRIFVSGISNCFNDIVMGIWGNISLIHMHNNTPAPVLKGIRQIERLIQHGSALIHIVFGYLAESRPEARQIRLNQLMQQINEASLHNDGILDAQTIESFLRWASSPRHPIHLSRSISRVIENLLRWIAKKHQLVLSRTGDDDAIRARLLKIDALIERGFSLTRQLRQYAGDAPVVMRRMRIKPLIEHALKQLPLNRCGIRLETALSTPLPDIPADRKQLSKVLKHLLVNAIDAMPQGGRLTVAAHTLSNTMSQWTLLATSGIDYIVISVSDSGEGIASRAQSRIFDPFYVGDRKTDHVGLGLSVASGIVKAHGGFIQVNSLQGRGSTFSIFLPYLQKSKFDLEFSRIGSGGYHLHCIHAAFAGRTQDSLNPSIS